MTGAPREGQRNGACQWWSEQHANTHKPGSHGAFIRSLDFRHNGKPLEALQGQRCDLISQCEGADVSVGACGGRYMVLCWDSRGRGGAGEMESDSGYV